MLLDDYLHIAHDAERAMAKLYCPRLEGRILDIGCGGRPYRRFLADGSSYVGLDSNPDVGPDVIGSVLALPFPDASFDGVICTEVLEHVPDPALALDEINRVLRAGGSLYLTVPQAWGLHYEPHDYYRYTRYGIEYLLGQAGFVTRELRQIGGLFSYVAVRLIDLVVTQLLFPAYRRAGLVRGRYRLAALIFLPLNLVLAPLTRALDSLDHINATGWAVLADKAPE
jgi:SAM-dependent methyltransferase